MPPTTKRVCLTAFELTKHTCFNIVTLEGIKQILVRFHREVLVKHPYISAAVLLLWSFYPQFPFHALYFVFYVVPRSIVLGILTCLGFEREGVRSGSLASGYQSRYGENTPRNGLFSTPQSYGAINHEPISTNRQDHPVVGILWRFLGWLILYASLVVLLKYGGQ
ncbi:hypothetical protein GALMADRAFT_241379 [Galerina marginata CBS 339.88]|uniref:Uncharacterized protein n=1 Tax=Galerina marginata (strain CBS 339.88) TaxID=685588 RepID=A0A067TCL0_GALM3|nr:hypothetical protein GALMADRAFT_241379 [Galerina marginata CBS 339.88]